MRTASIIFALFPLGILACGDKGGTGGEDSGTDTTDNAAPDIAVDLNVLDFGEIEPGSNRLVGLTISNRGDKTLTITDYVLDASSYGWISPQFPAGYGILSGLSNLVYFECAPDLATSGGSSSTGGATLIIKSDDPDEPEVVIGLSCDLLSDADGDGYESVEVGGDDCDDLNAAIHPDAEDAWYDGVDSNCDGANDYDQDGDSFMSAVYFPDLLTLPVGETLASEGGSFYLGGDCQDANPSIKPDYWKASSSSDPELIVNPNEVWYDGIDSNCDGANDYDQDGDGFGAESVGRGSDCNDLDATINIDNEERLNGADDNCDGAIDQDVPAFNADQVYIGDTASQQFGYAIVLGDLDDDGYDDILAGAPGYSSNGGLVAVFDAQNLPNSDSDGDGDIDEGSVLLTDGQNTITGPTSSGLGATITYYDDVRGAGKAAVAFGAPTYNSSAGIVYVMSASDAFFGGTTGSAYLTVTGSASSQRVGAGLSSQAEINGDGVNDYIGRYSSSSKHNLWLLYGGVQGDYTTATVDATFVADGTKTVSERSMSPTGDINGDGYGDFVFCDYAAGGGGTVWILWGSSTRYSTLGTSLSTAGTKIFEGNPYEQLGKTCGIGPDWNKDGVDELWVHVIDGSDRYAGIYMIEGSTDLEDDGQHPYDIYTNRYVTRGSDIGSYYFGLPGDWDNDGVDDVAFGLDASGVSFGRVWIFGSQDKPGDYTASSDNYAFVEGDDDAFQEDYGSAFSAIPGDIDGNGMTDFVAGDYNYDANYGLTANAGAVYIHLQTE